MKTNHFLKNSQIKKACKENRFIALRLPDLSQLFINCKIASLSRFKNIKDEMDSNYISYYSVSFQEYISNKVHFLK